MKVKLHCNYCNKEFTRRKCNVIYEDNYCSPNCCYEYKRVKSIKDNYKRIIKLDKDFINWFAGFWEGEGSVITCCIDRKRKTPRFTLYQSDLQIMTYIQKMFKLGRITKQKARGLSKRMGYVFQTSKFGECVLFAYILKGRLKSKYKKEQLGKWINSFKMKKYFKYIKE